MNLSDLLLSHSVDSLPTGKGNMTDELYVQDFQTKQNAR